MSWRARCEAALEGRPSDGVEVLHPVGPSLFGGDGARGLVSGAVAAVAFALSATRTGLGNAPLSPLPLSLQLVGLAAALHALVLLARLGRRWRTWSTARAHRLALCAEGLLLRTPAGDHAVAAADVVALCRVAEGASPRGGGWPEVVVVARGSAGVELVTVPPVFGPVGILLGRIRDRLAPAPRGPVPSPPAPTDLPGDHYDAAVRGRPAPGDTGIRHGWGWLRHGPYAALLFAVVFVRALLHLPEGLTAGPLALAVLAVCLLWPALWLLSARRVIAPRRGIALVLTPSEALVRTAGGFLRAPYAELASVEVEERPAWSVLDFRFTSRTLVLTLEGGDTLRMNEGFLAVPAGVVAAIVEGHRTGRFASPG